MGVRLSDEVRAELAAIEPGRPCCRLAEISALVRAAGSVHLHGGGRIGVHLDFASAGAARRAFSLLRGFAVRCEVRTYRRRAFERATRYQLHLGEDARALQTLNEAGILDARLAPVERPPARVVARSCCRAAYLRGAFLAAGSVTAPPTTHLEIRTAEHEGASFLANLGRRDGFDLHVYERRGQAVVYAKAREVVADLLAFLGASDTALRLGESAVVASTRGRANRLANADHANLARSSRAAEAQLRVIERLRERGLLDELPPDLRHVAELRRRHPTLSLGELARKARPPATKAGVQRRLAKLRRLADTR
ncbi:MAG: DNA-binding protein WhiA [Actinobacteria bacterium]|nr:DNA-binding protein WhiA [Actinomycetota bacterium]